jgi:hypothetical protein
MKKEDECALRWQLAPFTFLCDLSGLRFPNSQSQEQNWLIQRAIPVLCWDGQDLASSDFMIHLLSRVHTYLYFWAAWSRAGCLTTLSHNVTNPWIFIIHVKNKWHQGWKKILISAKYWARGFFLFVLRYWGTKLRTLILLGKCSTTWATPTILFALGCFSSRVSLFAQGWPQILILLPIASQVAGITGLLHSTWLVLLRLGWGGISLTFLPELASNQDLPDLYLLRSWDYTVLF